jgi:hypothetical protein
MLNIKYLFALIGLMATIAIIAVFRSNADQKPVEESSCFYLRSLHYTANGMAHWYSKENGGLEQLTGIPYSELGCKNCHDTLKPTEAHTAHGNKLDCKACHVRHVVSCTNCHFDTLVEKGVRKAIPVSGWVFLMNLDGKVTSASMQTFVTKGDKTFLMFAPHMSHSIMKDGRGCDVCHASKTMIDAQKGALTLTWLEHGNVVNLKGAIPVVDQVDYRCVYQNLIDGQWIPIENPDKPLRQYVAYGQPLSKEQLETLAKKQAAPVPKME